MNWNDRNLINTNFSFCKGRCGCVYLRISKKLIAVNTDPTCGL